MKSSFKLKALAAAAALGIGGNANAAIDLFATGNGNLVMFGATSAESAAFDLGYTIDTFLPDAGLTSALGQRIVWNFATNALSVTTGVGGAESTTTTPGFGAWAGAWSNFSDSAPSSRFGVIAGDSVNPVRYISTSNSTNVGTTSNSQLVAVTGVSTTYLNTVNQFGTHVTDGTGGSTVDSTAGNAFHDTGFGTADRWRNNVPFVASAADDQALNVYLLRTVAGSGATQIGAVSGGVTSYAGTFSFDSAAGTLTYQTAPVPEPGTYALMAAGLVGIGAMVRRRKAS